MDTQAIINPLRARKHLVTALALGSITLEVMQATSSHPLLLDVGHGPAPTQALNFTCLLLMFFASIAVARGEYLIVTAIFRRGQGGVFGDRAVRGFALAFAGSFGLWLWRFAPSLI